MIKWFKSLFFDRKKQTTNKALEERILVIENQIAEISNVIQKQSSLTAIVAGIQCDIINVLSEKQEAKKITARDLEEVLMTFAADDDDFIN